MCTQQITTHAPCGHHTRAEPRYCRYRFNIEHRISSVMVRSEAQCSKRKCRFQTGEGGETKGVGVAQGAGLRRTSSVLSELSLVGVEMQGESEWRKKLRGRMKREREKEREKMGELDLEGERGRGVLGLEAAGRSAGKAKLKGKRVMRFNVQVR
jgi:hypothetical protein